MMLSQSVEAEADSKAQSGNLIVLDKDEQQVYHPYTTKNKMYNNIDNKLAPNNLQRTMGYCHDD